MSIFAENTRKSWQKLYQDATDYYKLDKLALAKESCLKAIKLASEIYDNTAENIDYENSAEAFGRFALMGGMAELNAVSAL